MSEFVVSRPLIQEWEKKHKMLIEEATSLWRKIQAAKVLLDMTSADASPFDTRSSEPEVAPDDDNMRAAIENIANSAETPLSYREMKYRLAEEGFPEERLVNYFYTAIARLKLKGKITVDDKKMIGPRARS